MKDNTIHVLPVNDLMEHVEDETCECKPTIRYVDGGGKIVIHNSWDGREYWEKWEEEKGKIEQ